MHLEFESSMKKLFQVFVPTPAPAAAPECNL